MKSIQSQISVKMNRFYLIFCLGLILCNVNDLILADDTPYPKAYSYGYTVSDDYSGSQYNAQESADGQNVYGSYQVHLPDGRIQTVNYKADHYSGYVADVSYSGEAKYPPSNYYNKRKNYKVYDPTSLYRN